MITAVSKQNLESWNSCSNFEMKSLEIFRSFENDCAATRNEIILSHF